MITSPSLPLRLIQAAYRVVPVGRLFMPLARRAAAGREWRVPLRGTQASAIVSADSLMEAAVLLTGYWEREEAAALARWLHPGQTAFDIGANVGLHTLRMADLVGQRGSVYAFEPNPEVYGRLQRNVALNGFSHVRTFSCGVGPAGQATLHVNCAGNWNRNATLLADPQAGDTVGVEIPIIPLDDLWRQAGTPPVDLIKIDIEGYELSALKSGLAMLRECRPLILSEFSPHYCGLQGISWTDVETFYASLGYQLRSLDGASQAEPQATPHGYNFAAVPMRREGRLGQIGGLDHEIPGFSN